MLATPAAEHSKSARTATAIPSPAPDRLRPHLPPFASRGHDLRGGSLFARGRGYHRRQLLSHSCGRPLDDVVRTSSHTRHHKSHNVTLHRFSLVSEAKSLEGFF